MPFRGCFAYASRVMPVLMAFDRAAGAPIKVWFLPEMHPEGKIKLRDMNVQVRSGILSVRICAILRLTCNVRLPAHETTCLWLLWQQRMHALCFRKFSRIATPTACVCVLTGVH